MTSSPQYDDVIAREFDHHRPPTGFPGSVSDDVIMAAAAPEHQLSLNEVEDCTEEIIDDEIYDVTKDESRSTTLDYRKAESIV